LNKGKKKVKKFWAIQGVFGKVF